MEGNGVSNMAVANLPNWLAVGTSLDNQFIPDLCIYVSDR
jgi:hypothetical protein